MYRGTEVEYFQTKEARDARYRQIIADGYPCKRRSARNTVLSPSSISDFSGTAYPNGFGGTSAQWFSVLYIVEY